LQASQRLNKLTQILSDVEKGLIGIRNEKGNIAKEIESKQTLAKQYQEQRQRLISQTGTRLNVVPEWQTAWETAPTAFYNSWQQKHKDYTLLIEKIGKQTENLTKGCEALERIQSHEKNILESHPDWKPAVSPTPRQVNGLEIAFQTLNNQASGLSSKIRTHQESRHSLQNSLDTFIAENKDLNLARLTELSLTSAETIAQTQARHQTMSEQRNAAKALVESKQRELEQHLTRVHSTEAENIEIQKLKEQCADLNTALTEAIRQKGIQQGLLHKDETDRNQAEAEKQKESQIKREYDQWRTLNDIFGANNGGAFKKIAQSHLLGYLLQSANYHLQKLDKRYMLECIPGTLTISLRDCYQEGVKSPVDTLSGGESFLVSLALALALASLNNKSLNIDTLFIDEGFGTLGEQEMDRVLDLLENMQRQQGKRVGIISHIEHLASRIPIQIQASRTDESRSRLRVVDTSAG
ncbi:MAG: hypothetical protein IJ764_02580, partial [Bacteroidales bacterium]|nr:hypothetical protein [Bacteroidales bacterium]